MGPKHTVKDYGMIFDNIPPSHRPYTQMPRKPYEAYTQLRLLDNGSTLVCAVEGDTSVGTQAWEFLGQGVRGPGFRGPGFSSPMPF